MSYCAKVVRRRLERLLFQWCPVVERLGVALRRPVAGPAAPKASVFIGMHPTVDLRVEFYDVVVPVVALVAITVMHVKVRSKPTELLFCYRSVGRHPLSGVGILVLRVAATICSSSKILSAHGEHS